jgi:ABC-type amino acid transport system permease subunit
MINAREQEPIALYSMLAVMFFVICYALSRTINSMEHRTQLRTGQAAA